MSAEKPYMICASILRPELQFGGVKILHYNDAAAELHGIAPGAFVGRYLCELQEPEFREVGRRQHALRQFGRRCREQYATVIRTPEGALIGQRRRLLQRWEDTAGVLCYAVTIERVTELDHATLPDLASHGLTEANYEYACGKFTYTDLHNIFYSKSKRKYKLPFGRIFATIVRRLERVATDIYSSPGDGLRLALGDQSTWSLAGDPKNPKIRLKASCSHCGITWWRSTLLARTWRCPVCPARLGVDLDVGTVHHQGALGGEFAAVPHFAMEGS